MKSILIILYFFISLNAQYIDNKSCQECHEKIYDEFQSSQHSKGYFNNEFHKNVANKANNTKYSCAVCHMPSANNIKDLINGKARPNINNKTHTDAISCFFCHQIAYVKKAHKYKINILAKQANNYKPTLYGTLLNPESNDKHSSVNNPVYTKNICLGCHSYKLNDYNQTIFNAIKPKQTSQDCVDCHMPYISGGVDKYDKQARNRHISHKFLGIHDKDFRKKGLDINISYTNNTLFVKLKNKTTHPLIIQPARVKYIKITVQRNNNTIWQNFKIDPKEDKQALFSYTFLDKKKEKIIIPTKAMYYDYYNNIAQDETKILEYKNLKLNNDDIIKVSFYVVLAKQECSKVIKLENINLSRPSLMKTIQYKIKGIK
jgi:hypothetical protein